MICRLWRALYKRTSQVIVDEYMERDDKRKYVEGDSLDHLTEIVVVSGGRLMTSKYLKCNQQ